MLKRRRHAAGLLAGRCARASRRASRASRDGSPFRLRAAAGPSPNPAGRALEVHDRRTARRCPARRLIDVTPLRCSRELDEAVAVLEEQLDEVDELLAARASGRSGSARPGPRGRRRAAAPAARPSPTSRSAAPTKRSSVGQQLAAASCAAGASSPATGRSCVERRRRAARPGSRLAASAPLRLAQERERAARVAGLELGLAAARSPRACRLPASIARAELLAALAERREQHVEVVGQRGAAAGGGRRAPRRAASRRRSACRARRGSRAAPARGPRGRSPASRISTWTCACVSASRTPVSSSMWTNALRVRRRDRARPSGARRLRGSPGSTFTISVCSALVGRTKAVASLKTLPSCRGRGAASPAPARARPRTPTTLPAVTPATPTAGSFAGFRPWASGSIDVDLDTAPRRTGAGRPSWPACSRGR